MQQNSTNFSALEQVQYLVGSQEILMAMVQQTAREPFDPTVVQFLNTVSSLLMQSKEAKKYPDVITLGFWLRKSSVMNLKKRFTRSDNNIHLGRGLAFHIAPSNVPVNYAYSLATGLLTGNANIVRLPSKDFPQIKIINQAITEALNQCEGMKPYLCLVRYGREQDINDALSALCDLRIIWGGDSTIAELRHSLLPPRATEITFADRYSLTVIDSDAYLEQHNKTAIARDFYNDTYLTDQNACTSPRIVIWCGKSINAAKELFWQALHTEVMQRYTFQSIQGINKLTSAYLMAVSRPGSLVQPHEDNLLVRLQLPSVDDSIMALKDNSGYFFEYDCHTIMDIRALCNNLHCQTISYIGQKEMLFPLLNSGVKGIDRVVPVGKTMNFDLIWDGYDLVERMTRTIYIQ